MPITADGLLAPAGEIEPKFFPGEDSLAVRARLQSYLADGYARVPASVTDDATKDAIATAWAYYRAYKAIHLIMSRTAASRAVAGEASSTTLASQIATFAEERDNWLAEATRLIPIDVATIGEAPGSVHGCVVVDFPPWPFRP